MWKIGLVSLLAVVCIAEAAEPPHLEKLDRSNRKRPPPAEPHKDVTHDTTRGGGGVCPRTRHARNGITDEAKKWPRGESGKVEIPYFFSTKYDDDLQQVIFDAMKAIEDNTCIKFRERDYDKDDTVIAFMAHSSGSECSSSGVGKTKHIGRFHIIYLSEDDESTCFYHHLVIHELMHAIGLDHEHSRADREKFIDVDLNNVDEDEKSQFDIVTDNFCDYGCPYTYESVMHYKKTAFAKEKGLITMTPKNKDYLDVIGYAKKAHPNDYEKINRIYGCAEEAAGHTCAKRL